MPFLMIGEDNQHFAEGEFHQGGDGGGYLVMAEVEGFAFFDQIGQGLVGGEEVFEHTPGEVSLWVRTSRDSAP